MEIHYTGNGNLSGILGELVGRESGSLGSLGCVVFHVRMGFNGRCLMRVGLGPAPSFPFFMSSCVFYNSLHSNRTCSYVLMSLPFHL